MTTTALDLTAMTTDELRGLIAEANVELGRRTAPAKETSPGRFAVRSANGTGYYAIAGRRQSSAATRSPEKATIYATRAEAEAAIAVLAESAPSYFGPIHEPAVVDLSPPKAVRRPTDDGIRNPGGRCGECGYSHGHRQDCVFA